MNAKAPPRFEVAEVYELVRLHLKYARICFDRGEFFFALVALQAAWHARHFARAIRRWKRLEKFH